MNDTLIDAWDDPNRKYPTIVYVETTNFCNANCLSCLNDRCERTRGIMTLEDFKIIADKVKERGLKIGAMFCFGEPLMDDTLFEKYAYANSIDVLTLNHVGLNTNVSLLTPEKWDKILINTPNIILSFFNVGKEFERLTGGLNWKTCYDNAVNFIKYRDVVNPQYPIFIGCNDVKGSSMENVKKVFAGYNVQFVHDAELRWGGSVITGVVDRMIMYPNWRCDGYKGALQVKWNGDCGFCAYDITKGETIFANILADSWEEIERKFKAKWKDNTICPRCDYFHLCKRVIVNGFKYIEDFEWQKPFLKEGEGFVR